MNLNANKCNWFGKNLRKLKIRWKDWKENPLISAKTP